MARQPDKHLASVRTLSATRGARSVTTFQDVKREIQCPLSREVDEKPSRFRDVVERFSYEIEQRS